MAIGVDPKMVSIDGPNVPPTFEPAMVWPEPSRTLMRLDAWPRMRSGRPSRLRSARIATVASPEGNDPMISVPNPTLTSSVSTTRTSRAPSNLGTLRLKLSTSARSTATG